MRCIAGVLLVLTAAWTATAAASTWNFHPPLAASRDALVMADLEGDGISEAVLLGTASVENVLERAIFAVGGQPEMPQRLRSSALLHPDVPLTASLVRGKGSDGKDFVAVRAAADRVAVFGGVPLRRLRVLETTATLRRLIAIVNRNGDPKLVALVHGGGASSDSLPALIDFTTGVTEWVGSEQAQGAQVAPLGPNGELKLILAGIPGRVLDLATLDVEWVWPAGFGRDIIAGAFGTDGQGGFAARSNLSQDGVEARVDIFSGQPYSRIRSFTDTSSVHRIVAVPERGVVGDLIAFADGDELSLYRPASGGRIRTIFLDCGTPLSLAVGQVDASGEPRLVYTGVRGAGTSTCVAELATGATLYGETGENGPFSALARADLTGNGSDEVVMVSGPGASSQIRVLDAANGDLLRAKSLDGWGYSTPLVAAAQLDADPQLEVVIAREGVEDGPKVEVRDGQTLELEWTASISTSYPTPIGLATHDMNGDGVPVVLVLSAESRFIILDGRDGRELWRSVRLPSADTGGVDAFNLEGVPHAVIGADRGLYLVDLAGRTFVANTSLDARVVALRQWDSPTGCRLAVVAGVIASPTLSVHACDTLAAVAEWSLPFTPDAVWPLGDSADHFLLAGERHLHELRPDGTFARWPEVFGLQLAKRNQGDLRTSADGRQLDMTSGSSYQVGRLQLRLDDIFVDGFEARH